MTTSLTLPHWYDLHAHFRQDNILPATVADHIAMGCAGFLAMPNTKPPLTRVFESDETTTAGSIERYKNQLKSAATDQILDIIVPLYLCQDTTADMIEKGAKSGILKAAKYYPPHGTTGAEFGAPMQHYIDNGIIKALEDNGVTLCIHGEQHALNGEAYFDRKTNAEEQFYQNVIPKLVEQYPNLRIVGEHLTTKIGVDFILSAPDHVKATVTPQHLIYTVGHLLQGLKYHLYCLPLVKFEEDREALRKAVTAPNNTKFYAGTDSAPHTHKCTPCGCAAGCYTGAIAPQIYAHAFELASADLSNNKNAASFTRFLCTIGQEFYNLPKPDKTFTLTKSPQTISLKKIDEHHSLTPLPIGLGAGNGVDDIQIDWSLKL